MCSPSADMVAPMAVRVRYGSCSGSCPYRNNLRKGTTHPALTQSAIAIVAHPARVRAAMTVTAQAAAAKRMVSIVVRLSVRPYLKR